MRVVRTTDLQIKVIERGGICRIRHHGKGFLVECNRFRISSLRRAEFTQTYVWGGRKRVESICLLCTGKIAALEADLAELVLAPGDVFRGQVQGPSDGDCRAHQFSRARCVALEKAQIGHATVSLVGQPA